MQESTSSRPAPPTSTPASVNATHHLNQQSQKAAARQPRHDGKGSLPAKNANGKRPLDDEERVICAPSQSEKQLKGAAASKHVAGNKKPATKSNYAPAATTARATSNTSAATKASVAKKATTASKTTAGINKTSAAANKTSAAINARPRPQAPAPGTRFKLTAKEDIIRPAQRTDEQKAKEKAEQQARFEDMAEKSRNFQVNPMLKQLGKSAAPKLIRRTAKSAISSGTTSNTAKALAEKTNTTAAPRKRRSTAADLDDAPSPQKKRRAAGTQPARPSGKNTAHVENPPQEARARPARTTRATSEAKEKAVPAPKPARKAKQAPSQVFWEESSDGEESKLELVTKEEYEEGQGGKATEDNKKTVGTAATEPVTKKTAVEQPSTKRARDDSDDDEQTPAPKKAKAAVPAKRTSAATLDAGNPPPEPVAPCKKGVAVYTDPKVRKQHATQARRRADDAAWRRSQAEEKEAARKAGHTMARATDFLDM